MNSVPFSIFSVFMELDLDFSVQKLTIFIKKIFGICMRPQRGAVFTYKFNFKVLIDVFSFLPKTCLMITLFSSLIKSHIGLTMSSSELKPNISLICLLTKVIFSSASIVSGMFREIIFNTKSLIEESSSTPIFVPHS